MSRFFALHIIIKIQITWMNKWTRYFSADLFIAIFCMPFSYWHTLIFDDQRWVNHHNKICQSLISSLQIFGPVMCHLLAFLQSLSVFLSSWSLVVISFDRWMAIMFVLSPTMKLTRKRALYLIAVTWIFRFVYSFVRIIEK